MGIWFFVPLRSANTFFKRKKIEKKKVATERRRDGKARRNGINDGFCAMASPEKNFSLTEEENFCKGDVFMP